jgi:hypothetical protein
MEFPVGCVACAGADARTTGGIYVALFAGFIILLTQDIG